MTTCDTYTLPQVDSTWTVSCSPLETLVCAYINYIQYMDSNTTNAFEKTLNEKLKKTSIYQIRDVIVAFRSCNQHISEIHSNIMTEFTRKLNPILNTWESSLKLSPIENIKIGALAAAIESRILFVHNKLYRSFRNKNTLSYGKISSDWINTSFASYINQLKDLVPTLVEETRLAVSAAQVAGETEKHNKKKIATMQQIQQIQQIRQMQQLQQMQQIEIPGLHYNKITGQPTICVLLPNGTVGQSSLI